MGHIWDSGSGIFSCHKASPPQRIIWEIFSFLIPSLTEPLWKTWLRHKIPSPKEILVGGAGSGSMGNAERWEEPETRRDSICHRSSHTEASKGYKVLPPGDSPCLSLQNTQESQAKCWDTSATPGCGVGGISGLRIHVGRSKRGLKKELGTELANSWAGK